MNKLKKLIQISAATALVTCLAVAPAGAASQSGQHVNREIKGFLEKVNSGKGKPIEELTPTEARKVLVGLQDSVKVDVSGIDVSEKIISVDNRNISLTIVRPKGVKKTLPAFMYFHGGGWVLGDFQTHKRLVRDLVVGSGAAAVFVNYDPSPEVQYPVAINQAYAATSWVATHGKEINVDGTRLAVAGNSVGGNMAAVVALMAKNQNGPHIRLQVLLYPVTDANFNTESYDKFAKGHFLTTAMMKWFWDNYTTDSKKRAEIYASPLRASVEQLKGLPTALVQTAENDVLRDEGEAYAKKLDEAGVEVVAVRYKGMIHDFGLLNPLSQIPATKASLAQASQMLKQYLTK